MGNSNAKIAGARLGITLSRYNTGGSAARTRCPRGLIRYRERNIVFMYWDVVEVNPEPDYRLFVRFKDGLAGRVHRLQPVRLIVCAGRPTHYQVLVP
jgi:hypothetical protein